MHTKREIAAEVRQAITDQAGYINSEITDEKRLGIDLCLDRLDVVELVMNVEEIFGIEIAEEEAEKVNTVGDLIRTVEAKLTEKGQVAA